MDIRALPLIGLTAFAGVSVYNADQLVNTPLDPDFRDGVALASTSTRVPENRVTGALYQSLADLQAPDRISWVKFPG